MNLRAAREEDIPFLLALRAAALEPHERDAGLPVSAERSLDRVMAHFERGRIIEVDGAAVGIVKVVPEPDRWKLLQLQVLPSHQGQGLGTQAVRDILRDARAAKLPVVLTVLKVNPARRLYERLGFEVVGEREHAHEMRAEP